MSPITEGRKLVGIITNRDLKFETDFTKKIKESMTSEGLVTAKEGITLEEAKKILAKARKEKLPIVDEDFNLKGLITIKDIEENDQVSSFSERFPGTPSLRRRAGYYGECSGAHRGPCEGRPCGMWWFWIPPTDIL